MTLAAGARLGPYEILSAIGAGGMGEVYKARDTRLDRTVTIKVLPSHLSSSAEARQRFEREAKIVQGRERAGLAPRWQGAVLCHSR
jgi:eukaryotic-like serine/threonine-protein kinase